MLMKRIMWVSFTWWTMISMSCSRNVFCQYVFHTTQIVGTHDVRKFSTVSFPHHMNVGTYDDPKFSTVSFPHHMNVGTHDDPKFSTVSFPHHTECHHTES